MARKLLEKYGKWGLNINLERIFYMRCGAETKDFILEDQKGCVRGYEEFGKKIILRKELIRIENNSNAKLCSVEETYN